MTGRPNPSFTVSYSIGKLAASYHARKRANDISVESPAPYC
jgi:hypothetical protein